MKQAAERAGIIGNVRARLAAGATKAAACLAAGVSVSTYDRLSARYDEAGLYGLEDQPRAGRPPSVTLTDDEAGYLRRTYLRSNLKDGAGSMTTAARWAARDPQSPLRPEVRAAILKVRASKHILPVEVKRALRASEAEMRRYRDPASGRNDGIYTPGWLRMSADGSRRLSPGERQVWDDASVNVGVVVPWERGGDRCADRWGVRVARFQLLLGIDCACDFCPGYSYVMRPTDAYNAADVTAALWQVWRLNGYAPAECVMEGGAWQAERTRAFLAASGVQLVSAKGRPNQKLVEGWFNRLWTVMSVSLPGGQVGRFRGEMKAENDLWRRCREGVADPREHFPLLTDFLGCLDRSVNYLNSESVQSREYGIWTPCEAYAAAPAKGHPLPAGLRRFALPVRETRRLRRGGMVQVGAACPFGWTHPYAFASEAAWAYDGADVTVSFDPAEIREGAVIELARDWRGHRAGTVIDAAAPCVSPAPELLRTQSGFWRVGALDPRGEARDVKRASLAKVGARVAAFDERGTLARHEERETGGRMTEEYVFGGMPKAEIGAAAPAARDAAEWERMERAAGVLVS